MTGKTWRCLQCGAKGALNIYACETGDLTRTFGERYQHRLIPKAFDRGDRRSTGLMTRYHKWHAFNGCGGLASSLIRVL